MITYNEAKQLLNQGIFPCLINDGKIDYIISYIDNGLSCTSLDGYSYTAEDENSELLQIIIDNRKDDGGGAILK